LHAPVQGAAADTKRAEIDRPFTVHQRRGIPASGQFAESLLQGNPTIRQAATGEPGHSGGSRLNELLSCLSTRSAFGGYKQPGIGCETHKMMLDHCQQTKNLSVSYNSNALGSFL
jgi:hypothetical protein